MFKPTKLKSLAAVAGACFAMFAAAPANAYVYALSHLEVQDFRLVITPTAATTVGRYSFNLANTASMFGSNAPASSAACGGTTSSTTCGVAPVLNAAMANAPPSNLLRTENNFAFLNANGVNSYSGSDSVITTAELVTGTPTSLNQIAESLLNANGQAQANSEIQSNTSLSISFSIVGGPATLNLNFMADPDQRADIAGAIGDYLAQSNMNASITLTKSNGGGSIGWTPQGTAANDCTSSIAGAVCTELADTEDLNNNASAFFNPDTNDNSYEVGNVFSAFGIRIANLSAGNYTIALNSLTSTSISRAVPEPGSLALIGVALLGLGFGASRRQVKQG